MDYRKIKKDFLTWISKQPLGKSYNVKSNQGGWFVKQVAKAKITIEDLVLEMRAGFSRIDKELATIKSEIIDIKKDIALIKSCPTIKLELTNLKTK